jgi:hypothetical protein
MWWFSLQAVKVWFVGEFWPVRWGLIARLLWQRFPCILDILRGRFRDVETGVCLSSEVEIIWRIRKFPKVGENSTFAIIVDNLDGKVSFTVLPLCKKYYISWVSMTSQCGQSPKKWRNNVTYRLTTKWSKFSSSTKCSSTTNSSSSWARDPSGSATLAK